jgi:hypothetical protein
MIISAGIFRPERNQGESFEAYKKRRKLANLMADRIEGPVSEGGNFKHVQYGKLPPRDFTKGQNPKFRKSRKRVSKWAREGRYTCLRVGRIPLSRNRRVWRHGESMIYRNPLKQLHELLTIGRDPKTKQPLMHKDWKAAETAAKNGWGRVLHQMLRHHAG